MTVVVQVAVILQLVAFNKLRLLHFQCVTPNWLYPWLISNNMDLALALLWI
jgi:hypothetical protein